MKIKLYAFITVLSLVLCCILTLISGAMSWNDVWLSAQQRLMGLSSDWNPLLDERLPRLIVLLCTGASLAVSGAVMQALFHNPLASPSILGISSGGCLFAVLVLVCSESTLFVYPFSIPLAAFIGCLSTLCLVYYLAKLQRGADLERLILTGLAVSSLIIAIQGLLLYSLRDHWQLIQTVTEWEAGSSLDRGWNHVHMQLPLAIVGLCGCWHYRREMNLLSLGEEEAKNLGVDVSRVRWRLFLCVSILTSGAIAALGMVAFFGLILPHVMRSLVGPDNRRLIPACLVGGAVTLSGLDLFLRHFELYFISIGHLSAIIGGFFFMILLFRSSQTQGDFRC